MANELTAQQVETLLSRLANDDEFRAALEVDASAALKSAGLPETLAACFAKSPGLPAKSAARSAAAALSKAGDSTMAQNIHALCR